jgi:hypothetical protein
VERAAGYRRYAAECVRVARQASNPNDKAMLLEMAQKWQELAEKIEQQTKRSEGRSGAHRSDDP